MVYMPYYFLGHNSMLIAGSSGLFWALDNHLFIAQLRVLLFVVLCFATHMYIHTTERHNRCPFIMEST